MFQNKSKTVADYLASLAPERRAAIEPVLKLVRKHVPKGYQETISFGAIGWVVPLEKYPTTYNGQPLGYIALASQKNYASLYLMNAYADGPLAQRLRDGFKAAGKKLDMGKACVRFKTPDDLALDVVAEVVGATPMADYIAGAERVRTRSKRSTQDSERKSKKSRRQAAPARSRSSKPTKRRQSRGSDS
jgi:uncharacterized protein DUF1801